MHDNGLCVEVRETMARRKYTRFDRETVAKLTALSYPIEGLELPVGAYNALRYYGFRIILEVLIASETGRLSVIDGIGQKRRAVINDALDAYIERCAIEF